MGFLHKFRAARSGSSVIEELKTTTTSTLCKASSNEYEIVNQYIGHGNYAEVKLAKRRRDGQVFALKMFRKNAVSSRMVQAEFYIAQGLRHKNIIATYELCTLDFSHGVVMEYAPSCLYDLVSASKLQTGDSERYLADLVCGVEYIHRLGFVHRDLKLENVVIGVDGYAKIIDFGTVGVAKFGPTTIIGSSAYMAPELFIDSKYDPIMADIWSLGVVYACMMLGRFPWSVAQKQNADFAAYSSVDLKLPASDLTLQSEISLQDLPSLIRRLPLDMRGVVHSMLRVQRTKRSGLAAIGERISHIRNQQMEASERASIEAAISDFARSEDASNDRLSLSETYHAKASSRLSGETLCTIIEVRAG